MSSVTCPVTITRDTLSCHANSTQPPCNISNISNQDDISDDNDKDKDTHKDKDNDKDKDTHKDKYEDTRHAELPCKLNLSSVHPVEPGIVQSHLSGKTQRQLNKMSTN